jgi:hypothetical protein
VSGNTGAINNLLTEAQVAKAIPIGRMNADALMINTLSGVVRIAKAIDAHDAAWGKREPALGWTLLDHHREHYISKIVPVEVAVGLLARQVGLSFVSSSEFAAEKSEHQIMSDIYQEWRASYADRVWHRTSGFTQSKLTASAPTRCSPSKFSRIMRSTSA